MTREIDDPSGQPTQDTVTAADQAAQEEAVRVLQQDATKAFDDLKAQATLAQPIDQRPSFPAPGAFYRMHLIQGYYVEGKVVDVEYFEVSSGDRPASQTFQGPPFDRRIIVGVPDEQGEYQTTSGQHYTPSYMFRETNGAVFATKYTVVDGQLIAGPEVALPQVPGEDMRTLVRDLFIGAERKTRVDAKGKPLTFPTGTSQGPRRNIR